MNYTYVNFGTLLQQIVEHIGLSVVGSNVQRIALAHLCIYIEGFRFADALHLIKVAVLDGPHDFVHDARNVLCPVANKNPLNNSTKTGVFQHKND